MSKLIAIIDDDIDMEYLYTLILSEVVESGALIAQFFSDSRDLGPWLQHNQPDLILSDISMPHLSGTELGHCIRKMGITAPTYFVSGHLESEYSKELNEIGGCRYFTKPFNTANFLQTLISDLGIKDQSGTSLEF